jgi:membrane protease subunit (stomatin/prohibitin family)
VKGAALPFGFTSPFRVQVVFISRRTFLDQKWGTREPVVFRDRELGVVRLRAFGTYAYRIADSRTFVNTVVGSLGQFDTGRLQDFYRDLVVARLNDLLGENLTSILDFPASYDELAALAKARLREDFGKYGVDLSDFYVASVTPPDEVLARLDERAAMGAIGDLSAYARFKAAVAMGDAAKAEGGGGAGAGSGSASERGSASRWRVPSARRCAARPRARLRLRPPVPSAALPCRSAPASAPGAAPRPRAPHARRAASRCRWAPASAPGVARR